MSIESKEIIELVEVLRQALPTIQTVGALEARIKELEKSIKKKEKRAKGEPTSFRKRTIPKMIDVLQAILYAKTFQGDKAFYEELRRGYMPRSKLQKLMRVDADTFQKLLNECTSQRRVQRFTFEYGMDDRYPTFKGIMYKYLPQSSLMGDERYAIELMTCDDDNLELLAKEEFFTPEKREIISQIVNKPHLF
jgi:hypothetical protein